MNLLPTEIAHIIAHRCDTPAHTNFCLAYKSLYIYDSKWLLSHFEFTISDYLREVQTKHTKLARLRVIHKIYRFIVVHKYLLKHPKFANSNFPAIVESKLREISEQGMCKRKSNKYMKELKPFI